MYTVSILHSPEHDKIYIGFTSNLEAKLSSHNEIGTKGWTIKFRPWELLHTEEFPTRTVAMERGKN